MEIGLFPAQAGVILVLASDIGNEPTVPRASGGDPSKIGVRGK